jgi:hypothetical protein
MSCRTYTPSDTCGNPVESPCVRVEITFPSISSLFSTTCTTLDVVLEDIYSILESYDISTYDKGCLTIEEITLVNVLQAQTDKICELEDRIEFLEDPCNILNMDITSCGIDVSCLQANDPCDPVTPITTLKELLVKLIEKACE